MRYVLSLICVLITLTMNTICTPSSSVAVNIDPYLPPSKLEEFKIFNYVFYHTGSATTNIDNPPTITIDSNEVEVKVIKTGGVKKEICQLNVTLNLVPGRPLLFNKIHLLTCNSRNCAKENLKIFFVQGEIQGVENMQAFHDRELSLDLECWTTSKGEREVTLTEKFIFKASVSRSVPLKSQQELNNFEITNHQDPFFIAFGMAEKTDLRGVKVFGHLEASHPVVKIRRRFPFYYQNTVSEYFIDYDNSVREPIFGGVYIMTVIPFKIYALKLYTWRIDKSTVRMELSFERSAQKKPGECRAMLVPENKEHFRKSNLPLTIFLFHLDSLNSGKQVYFYFEPNVLGGLTDLKQLDEQTMLLYIICKNLKNDFIPPNIIVRRLKIEVPRSIPLIRSKANDIANTVESVDPKKPGKIVFLPFAIPEEGLKQDFLAARTLRQKEDGTFSLKPFYVLKDSVPDQTILQWEKSRFQSINIEKAPDVPKAVQPDVGTGASVKQTKDNQPTLNTSPSNPILPKPEVSGSVKMDGASKADTVILGRQTLSNGQQTREGNSSTHSVQSHNDNTIVPPQLESGNGNHHPKKHDSSLPSNQQPQNQTSTESNGCKKKMTTGLIFTFFFLLTF